MPEITKCSMHEPNCSTARHWQSPRQPQWAGWRDLPLHRATGCSLLPSKLMLPSGRSKPGPGPWDSPDGQSSPRREAVHSHPQGTRTLPRELLPAQRTSGIGSGVELVPAPCSCSCRHSVFYLAPHPRLLAPQPLARHRATGGLCLKGNSAVCQPLLLPSSQAPSASPTWQAWRTQVLGNIIHFLFPAQEE